MTHVKLHYDDRNDRRRQAAYGMAFNLGTKISEAPAPVNQFAEVFHELFLLELMNAAAKVGVYAIEPRYEIEEDE